VTRAIHKRGILVEGDWYAHPDLARRIGQLVQVFPKPPDAIFVRGLAGETICIARLVAPPEAAAP
jgi:hypothetical protein